MVIKASSAGEIRRLVDALGSSDEVRREVAIARLAIIGARAINRLLGAYRAASDRDTRIAILRALESTGDGRAAAIARQALAAGGDEAVAAIAALRGLLDSTHAPTAAAALDAVVAAALDGSAERRVRLAALEALHEMPAPIPERLAAALQADPDAGIRAGAGVRGSGAAERRRADADATWADALEGDLPDDPGVLRDILQSRGWGLRVGTDHEGGAGATRGVWRRVLGVDDGGAHRQ